MRKTTDLQRYAAGALLALILREAQVHQLSIRTFSFLPSDFEEPADLPKTELWINEKFGLLRPVFRHLKIESHAWRGLEETALLCPAGNHIYAFLSILFNGVEEEKSSSSTRSNSEAELAKVVDAMATIFESKRTSLSPRGRRESSRVSKYEGAQANNEHYIDGISEALDVTQGACQSISAGLNSASEYRSNEKKMIKWQLLTEERKMAIMLELLAACVADTVEDDRQRPSFRRGYDARHRVALRLLATLFDLNWTIVSAMEITIASSAMAKLNEGAVEAQNRYSQKSKWSKWKRRGIIGAAALTGGTLLAVTGGLAAPAIAAGLTALAPILGTILPIVGAGGFAAITSAASSVVVPIAAAASFGAAGASLSGTKMARRTGGVQEYGFIPIGKNHNNGRLAVGIMVSGFIEDVGDFTRPWRNNDGDMERYALCWESENLIKLSTAIEDWLRSTIVTEIIKEGAMLTVLKTLVAAVALPTTLLAATDLIDNIWSISVDRSDKAGVLLAQSLLTVAHRPVTLVGFSLGARVIFRCLEELSKRGENAGVVERVVLMGAPIPLHSKRWKIARKMVAGRFINCYSTNDWILGIMYRANLLTPGLAGIQPVQNPGIENVDVTPVVRGHSAYLWQASKILKKIDLDEFYPVFPIDWGSS